MIEWVACSLKIQHLLTTCDESFDSASGSSKRKKKKLSFSWYYKKSYIHFSNVDVPFEIGHCFVDENAFRAALCDYAIKEVYKHKKNDTHKVTTIYSANGCP